MHDRLFTVRRYVTRVRHGGFECHGTTRYLANGQSEDTYGRTFECACGEALLDGDPYVDGRRGLAHANCAELVA